MKKLCVLFISLILMLSLAVSPVFAAGGKNHGDVGAGGVNQGDVGNVSSPGSDAKSNQVD